ncbi:uncharacterized protein LOC135144244 [Zophobas morio]|uniref:uncharacterized protein LOC135144244 n=1 Tax=Zophobas morio TaxID=2755281 RepID=UPI00308300E3
MNLDFHELALIFCRDVQVHIYSSPNFLMESVINMLMFVFHYLLINEVNILIETINAPLLRPQISQVSEDIKHQDSNYQGVICSHPDLGVDVVFKQSSLFQGRWDTARKINKILSTTLSGYMRRNMQKKKSDLGIGSNSDQQMQAGPITQTLCELSMQQPNLKDEDLYADLYRIERTEVVRLH